MYIKNLLCACKSWLIVLENIFFKVYAYFNCSLFKKIIQFIKSTKHSVRSLTSVEYIVLNNRFLKSHVRQCLTHNCMVGFICKQPGKMCTQCCNLELEAAQKVQQSHHQFLLRGETNETGDQQRHSGYNIS